MECFFQKHLKHRTFPTETSNISNRNIEHFQQKHRTFPTETSNISNRNIEHFQQKHRTFPTETQNIRNLEGVTQSSSPISSRHIPPEKESSICQCKLSFCYLCGQFSCFSCSCYFFVDFLVV